MVIASSDSTSTLVSLDNNNNHGCSFQSSRIEVTSQQQSQPTQQFRSTRLLVPAIDYDDDHDDYDCECDVSSSVSSSAASSSPLYLPVQHQQDDDSTTMMMSVDECLYHVAALRESAEELIVQSPVQIAAENKKKILYVGQGEIAHCTCDQTDVLVSDRATTCHIVALRSTTNTTSAPLCTMAHVDGTSYAACLRTAFQEHYKYHHDSAVSSSNSSTIHLDIHIVGGFDDVHGSSRDITTWLFHTLADIAEEYVDDMICTIRTCCVSSINHNRLYDAPHIRGLALECSSGRVFVPTLCPDSILGPASTLRVARLWSPQQQHHSSSSSSRQLYVIHTPYSNEICLSPFLYELPDDTASILLSWSDERLLQTCSTSPHCEEVDFCDSLRATIQFIQSTPWTSVFVVPVQRSLRSRRPTSSSSSKIQMTKTLRSLRFRRCPNQPNTWVPVK